MNFSEIVIGERALAQVSANTREIVEIKGVNDESGLVIVRLSDGKITEIHPQYIIKTFGIL